jgi:hypothetical protein
MPASRNPLSLSLSLGSCADLSLGSLCDNNKKQITQNAGPSSSPAVLPQEQDYLELLTGAGEAKGDDSTRDGGGMASDGDQELYAELRRQEKQALVDKILKAKRRQEQQQQAKGGGSGGGGGGGAGAMAPNKGQPSPYIQRKVKYNAVEGAGEPEAVAHLIPSIQPPSPPPPAPFLCE